jgi:hypothetical protein
MAGHKLLKDLRNWIDRRFHRLEILEEPHMSQVDEVLMKHV